MKASKQKAIREAYLELFKNEPQSNERFDSIVNFIDDNGWISGSLFGIDTELLDKSGHEERPKSLQGIETNNGWIKIESEADLPNNYQETYFIIKGSEQKMKVGYYYDEAFITLNDSHYKNIATHYQPIIKPQPPIY